jgi:hypothetical protein
MPPRRTSVSTIILATLDGTPWTSNGFRASWRKAQAKAGVVGVNLNDLRGTAVTRLALVWIRRGRDCIHHRP